MSRALIFRHDMHEVTGFGGEYEQRVRAAIEIGAAWMRDFGPFERTELEKYISNHQVLRANRHMIALGKLLSRAQMGIVMYHLRFISEYGWDTYCERMSSPVKFVERAA
jgi:hypothetical protein